MEHLIFVCPITGQAVDTGIEMPDVDTLRRIREETVRAHCAACGRWHDWPARDALPAKAA